MGPAGCQVRSDPVSLNLSIISTEWKCSEAKYYCRELGGVRGYSPRSSAIIHNWEITAPDIMTPGCTVLYTQFTRADIMSMGI